MRKKTFLNLFLLIFLIFLLQLLRLQDLSFKDKNFSLILADDNNPPLCTQLSAAPTSGGAQLTVAFLGKGSAQEGEITQVRFVFGDKGEEIKKEEFGKSIEVATSHVYKLPGSYIASFFLSDSRGFETGGNKDCRVTVNVEGETLPAEAI